MKNKLFISNVRKIKSSSKRFISLLFLSMLGVGFFVGIKATSPDMLVTLDDYLKNTSTYDLEVVSTLGLTKDDVNAIEKLKIAKEIVPVKSIDEIITFENQEKIVRIIALSNINRVTLNEGAMPSRNDEIVVEDKLLKENDLKIGDSITINNEKLTNSNYKIVGTISSPLYFSSYRGTTTVGNGELNYYTYVLSDTLNMDYYTNIYLTLPNQDLITNSENYKKSIDEASKKLESIKSIQEDRRYNSLYQEQIDYMNSLGVKIDNSLFERPMWHIFNRENNQAYNTFIDATESLKQLGSVFPLVFYIVAILISLISMTRMVDEDRTEIGTLKGLGFSSTHIISKYIMYSLLATMVGGIIGMFIGFNLLPKVIWNIYNSLFNIPNFISQFNFYYAFVGLSIAILCICGATIITALNVLKEKPSSLMRPKAPKIGKKILLEKIPLFWGRLKFSNKITIRNIFRYKRRVLVTIIGIIGSTSLILVGFGLKDSVNNVVYYNYNNVFIYDDMINLKESSDTKELLKLLNNNTEIESTVLASYEVVNIYNADKDNLEVNLIVPDDKDALPDVIRLNDINNDKKEIILSDNIVALSEKLAKTLKVKKDDYIYFSVDNELKKVKVGYIVENYVQDYAYMTKDTYEGIFKDYSINTIFLKTTDDYDDSFNNLIMENESVSNLITTKATSELIGNVLSSLNSVVIILIVASAILAFVILYNLSTINISERKREISTLKVLGFYDEEVDSYITKENYFITIIGTSIGLVFGLYLSHYIISTCEPQFVMFIRHVEIPSYIISAFLSFSFTIIVNKITHRNLKKIDMVESLKNNE